MPPIDKTETETETTEETSLRDALSAAFDTPAADTGEQQAAPAEAAPAQETDEQGQPRDDQGRWTKAQQEHFEKQQAEQAAQEQQQGEQELRLAPPHGWSPQAKAAYANLPPEVQEAVARREVEINNGFRTLQRYKGLDDYAAMAESSGTTLKDALDRYRAAEQTLEENFPQGVMKLCEMYQIHPVQLANQFLQAFGQAPGATPQGGRTLDPTAHLLAQRLHGMEETVRTLLTERQRAEEETINGTLQAFAQEHMYFENVRQDMSDLIRSGRASDLKEAYDMACWMNPQIRPLLINEQAAPQNTRDRIERARRASSGLRTGAAPAGNLQQGSNGNSVRDALLEAWDGAGI